MTYCEEHVRHVLLDRLDVRHDILRFADAHTLARKDCLINAEAARRHGQEPAVCGDPVTDRHDDDVTWNNPRRWYAVGFAGAEHPGFIGGILHQGLIMRRVSAIVILVTRENAAHINGFFRIALLNNTDRGVCNKDEEDYRGLHESTERRGIFLGFE
jgi:hypothetical protein